MYHTVSVLTYYIIYEHIFTTITFKSLTPSSQRCYWIDIATEHAFVRGKDTCNLDGESGEHDSHEECSWHAKDGCDCFRVVEKSKCVDKCRIPRYALNILLLLYLLS